MALAYDSGDLYYKTLRIRNLWLMARFRSKPVPFIMSVTSTLASYGILKLRVQAPEVVAKKAPCIKCASYQKQLL